MNTRNTPSSISRRGRFLCGALVFALSMMGSARAQSPAGVVVGWDQPDSEFQNSEPILRFEVQLDGAAVWLGIGVPAKANDALTLPGTSTYTYTPPVGTKALAVRACNAVGCSPPSVTLSFVVPSIPKNLRIVKSGG